MQILLNNQAFQFTNKHLPLLISGGHGAGSSLFTIHVMRQLVQAGEKILFFTALPAAKEDFKNLLSEDELLETEFVENGERIEGKRIIVLMSGEESAFLNAMEQISDSDQRILLVKNMDRFSSKLFDVVKSKKKLVLSGDLDETSFNDQLHDVDFGAKVFFSNPSKWPLDSFPSMEKYSGYMTSKDDNGVIGLK